MEKKKNREKKEWVKPRIEKVELVFDKDMAAVCWVSTVTSSQGGCQNGTACPHG